MRPLLRIIAVTVVGVVTVGVRLANPDMTETRLFIEFLPTWLSAAFILVGVYALTDGGRTR